MMFDACGLCRPMILSPASASLRSSSQASTSTTVSVEAADVTEHKHLLFPAHSFSIILLVDNMEIFGQG